MEIYSEYMEGDRKATVTRLQKGWDRAFDVWEVALYVQGKPIQRTTCASEPAAEQIAEDFVQGYGSSGPTLLSEHVSNG
jgi:hypothetical protein